jgi:PIN domain nuclease of toxin-antitoxin system
VSEQLRVNGFGVLDIKKEHAFFICTMAFLHKNPFDRLLIAQSIIEQLPIVGNDVEFDAYSVNRLW